MWILQISLEWTFQTLILHSSSQSLVLVRVIIGNALKYKSQTAGVAFVRGIVGVCEPLLHLLSGPAHGDPKGSRIQDPGEAPVCVGTRTSTWCPGPRPSPSHLASAQGEEAAASSLLVSVWFWTCGCSCDAQAEPPGSAYQLWSCGLGYGQCPWNFKEGQSAGKCLGQVNPVFLPCQQSTYSSWPLTIPIQIKAQLLMRLPIFYVSNIINVIS